MESGWRRLNTHSDIVVIGAGVAGLAAGIAARKAGLTASVVEREPNPPDRPGETLHPGAGPVFDRLGLLADLERLATSRPLGIEVSGPNSSRLPFGGPVGAPWAGYQIDRRSLSKVMVEHAQDLGVEFLFGEAVRSLDCAKDHVSVGLPSRTIFASWCCDATGFSNLSHRKVSGRMQSLGPQMTVRYRYVADGAVCADWPRITLRPGGWRWQAQLTPSRFAEVELSQRRGFETARNDATWAYADGTWRVSACPADQRVFRIGDAGGRLDPAAGKGMLRAAMSAMMAVHLIHAVLQRSIGADKARTFYSRWFRDWVVQDCRELAPLVLKQGVWPIVGQRPRPDAV
ncbi:MAG: NAD(P)/FAD-dependent oxidoreductase [Ruegeria sp.]